MDDTQLEFYDRSTAAFIAPGVRADDVDLLCRALAGRGWRTACELSDAIHPWHDRKIRAVAQHSAGRILSGQQGYKLTVECTPEEMHHAKTWLRSQARQMIARSIQIEKRFHNSAARGVRDEVISQESTVNGTQS